MRAISDSICRKIIIHQQCEEKIEFGVFYLCLQILLPDVLLKLIREVDLDGDLGHSGIIW